MGDSPTEKLPAALPRFVQQFNRGEFWASHETLEDEWRATGSEFYHGLILYASAFVHVARGNPHGIVAQLNKAEDALRGYPETYLGLDVEEIRRHIAHSRRLVEEHRDTAGRVEWKDLIPSLQLEPSADRIHGDEPELGR